MRIFHKMMSFLSSNKKPVQIYHDQIFGEMKYDPDSEGWNVPLMCDKKEITLTVDGNWNAAGSDVVVPSAELLRWAYRINDDIITFINDLNKFIQLELATNDNIVEFKRELSGLQISGIHLGPDANMGVAVVTFDGGSDDRSWRCDYNNYEPIAFGYDS